MNWLPCPRSDRLAGFRMLYVMFHTIEDGVLHSFFFFSPEFLCKENDFEPARLKGRSCYCHTYLCFYVFVRFVSLQNVPSTTEQILMMFSESSYWMNRRTQNKMAVTRP